MFMPPSLAKASEMLGSVVVTDGPSQTLGIGALGGHEP
jgi:hypothetical protein